MPVPADQIPATSGPLPISAAIVCKNSAATIGRTLESLRGLCAEILAIDSGSTDQTIPMLEAAGAKIIRSEWLGHVRTKQLALESCSQAWVLSVDSDESPQPDLVASIRGAFAGLGPPADVHGYELNRVVWYRERPLLHSWQPEWRLRLVRRGSARWGGLDPHDKLSLTTGRTARLTGLLRHDSFATFREHLGKQLGYSRLSAEGMLKEGRRSSLLRFAVSPMGAMLKQLVIKQSWRDGYPGWLAAGTTAAGALMKHMILIELEREQR